jgi:hypothetical protein
MKTLEIKQMTQIQGGDAVDEFCAGFGAVAAVYQVGVWANLWNPVGWVAGGAAAIIGTGCAINALT